MLNLKSLVLLCRWSAPLLALVLALICAGCDSGPAPLTAEMPLHLEDHLGEARIIGSDVPIGVLQPIEWSFGEVGVEWKPFADPQKGPDFPRTPVKTKNLEDAIRLTLSGKNRGNIWPFSGMLYSELPGLNREDWSHVIVRVRAMQPGRLSLIFGSESELLRSAGSTLISDGRIHSYKLPIRWEHLADAKWEKIGFLIVSKAAGTFDMLSAEVVPKASLYADAAAGVSQVRLVGNPGIWTEGGRVRRALFAHTPGRVEYRVRVPHGGRLDFGLGVLRSDMPIRFRVTAAFENEVEILFEEEYSDSTDWVQRSVDLSHRTGQLVDLALVTESPQDGIIALWLTPTLTGSESVGFPNVIFYVIDGAGADWMSLYGYNRRTTPNLERLAAEGAVFEHAYSNATWTKLSTVSYMTSLYYSSLGGHRTHSDRIPDNTVTMAEHFGRAGYQTAVFTSNAYAATMSGLERGVDTVHVMSVPFEAVSSEHLHGEFWRWREAYPGRPYWVHFQTTDVHEDFEPQAPFAGLYVNPQRRAVYREWDQAVEDAGGFDDRNAYEKAGISIEEHALAQQGLYDEGMAHQDHELGRLVERLKEAGEWENTLLIIASDHGYPAGSHRLMEPMQEAAPYLHPFATRIPLIFIWPNHIPGGQRFTDEFR